MSRSHKRSPHTCLAIFPVTMSLCAAIASTSDFNRTLTAILAPAAAIALVLLKSAVVYNTACRASLSRIGRPCWIFSSLGKSALITGASKGIGRVTALTLAAEGCSVHLAARSGDALETLRNEILARHKVKVDLHPGDLSSTQSMLALAHGVGDIDILINNAGDIPAGTVEALTDADWRRGFDLKLFGYINLTREIYVGMKKRGSGVIINNIGNSGENWDYDYVAGSTGNAALMSFTKARRRREPRLRDTRGGREPGTDRHRPHGAHHEAARPRPSRRRSRVGRNTWRTIPADAWARTRKWPT